MASASASRALRLSKLSLLPAAPSRALRPLAAAGSLLPAARGPSPAAAPWAAARGFATQPATSSLRDNSPNWSNRPPKETILLDGCDFEHWLVVMDPPPGNPGNPDVPREEIIDTYIKTLAQIVGSEEEARMKIYSVSTRHYFAFGALVSEELSYKLKELPKVRWVLPDSYLDVKNKDYGGEPFIDGQAVAYDPKYHEEWVRNSVHAGERIRRGDRPRNLPAAAAQMAEGVPSIMLSTLASSVPNLETLTLRPSREIADAQIIPSKFLHLKYLSIHIDNWSNGREYDFLSLVSFLDASPSLETFSLSVPVQSKYDFIAGDPSTLRQMPGRHHDKPKTVTITGFCRQTSLVELTRHILESAVSLKSLMLITIDPKYQFYGHISIRKCPTLDKEYIRDVWESIRAVKTYIEGGVPSTVKFKAYGPCRQCHAL